MSKASSNLTSFCFEALDVTGRISTFTLTPENVSTRLFYLSRKERYTEFLSRETDSAKLSLLASILNPQMVKYIIDDQGELLYADKIVKLRAAR